MECSRGPSVRDSESDSLVCLQSSLDALDEEKPLTSDLLGLFPEDQRIPATILIDIWAESYRIDEDTLSTANLYELDCRRLANLVVTWKDNRDGDGYYSQHSVTQHDMLRELSQQMSPDPIQHRKRLMIPICENILPTWWTEHKYQFIKARLLSILTGPSRGVVFSALYVKEKSSSTKLLRDQVCKMEILELLIFVIKNNNIKVDRDNRELHEIQKQMEDGILLISKCSKLKSGPWNNGKKKKYTNKLVELDKSLTRWLEILRQQARDLIRMEVLMLRQIDEQRKTRETLATARNTADGTIDVVVENQSEMQNGMKDTMVESQSFSRQIQNYRMVYGSWATMFIVFLVGMVMATGSTGTKWFVFNVGINYLGINN